MRVTPVRVSRLERHTQDTRHKGEYRRADLADLSTSIRQHGLLQPLIVQRSDEGYEILAGHRRYAALQALGAKEAPCVVLDPEDDQAALSVLLTDNAQHKAVDPLMEADVVKRLVEGLSEDKHPQDRAAATLGKSVAWIRARLRLTTLSPSWREAFADPKHPVSQFPVGHLDLIAALSDSVQERAFQDWSGWWDEGVPLKEDIRRMVAEYTRDLADVPWDVQDSNLVTATPACSACPKRDSAQGDLFGGLGGVRNAKSDRCLDATCFESKRRAVVYRRIEEARGKYGDSLRLELPWTLRDIPMPEGVKVHQEHELTPLTKAKGGMPVLRLRTMKVKYMGKGSRAASPSTGAGAQPLQAHGRAKPKTLDERRQALHKRRLVRALDILQGSLMNRTVHVGTAKHPEEMIPPEPEPPSLENLITYVLVYGTGPSVDPDGDGYDPYVTDNAEELDCLAKETTSRAKETTSRAKRAALRTRTRLWNRVREPIARSLRTFSGMSLSGAERMSAAAARLCSEAGLDWAKQFLQPATEAIPEPASWSRLNEDGTPRRERAR